MQNDVKNFNYPKAIQALRKYGVDSYEVPEMDVLMGKCLLDIDEYMARYFSDDFEEKTQHFLRSVTLPNPKPNKESGKLAFRYAKERVTSHEEAMTDEMRQYLRKNKLSREVTRYFLTEEEIDDAKAYLHQKPELKTAIAALQGCLSSYFDGLYAKTADFYSLGARPLNPLEHSQLDRKLKPFKSEAAGFSFIHDLLPVIALSLSRNEEPEITSYSLGKALCDAFRQQAFKSYEGRPNTLNRDRYCPFSSYITSIFSRRIDIQDNGSVSVQANQKPGELLYSLIMLIKNRSDLDANAAMQYA